MVWDQLQREFAELHLVVNQEKSRLTKLEEGFAFLGFEFRKARGRMLLMWPPTKACCNIRSFIKWIGRYGANCSYGSGASISVLGERLGEGGTTMSFMNDVGCIEWSGR
jgi:hypothetical protein